MWKSCSRIWGIFIEDDSDNNAINGNLCYGNDSYDIKVGANCDRMVINGNYLEHNIPVVDLGIGTNIFNNGEPYT